MSNLEALDQTLEALDVEDIDAAKIEIARSLARAVDRKPQSPGLWREYREAIRELTADERDDDAAAELLYRLHSSVRNS